MASEQADTPVTLLNSDLSNMSANERIKVESKGLVYIADKAGTHTFRDEIDALDRGEPTISGTAKELSKFFGIYKQQARGERGKKTDDYFFMLRLRIPAGGRLDAKQWAALDDAAERFADGTIRITSRQSIQYHHVYGPSLAPLVRHLNRSYRGNATIAACGDVNRNVMTSPLDEIDPQYEPRSTELAEAISTELAPRSSGYFEAFLAGADGATGTPVNATEPIYGEHYLPRKFKIGIAHPSDNSVDLLTQDVGLLPIVADGKCDGSVFDLYTGGGMGMTHNNPKTAPLLGLYLGRVPRAQVVDVSRSIAILQKEHGERKDRKAARWKYTIRRIGVDFVKSELRSRFGIALEDAAPQPIPPMRLHLGWNRQRDGRSWYGLSVESGRLKEGARKAVREAVVRLGLTVKLTPQQDLLLCDVADADRAALEAILAEHGARRSEDVSLVRQNAMACPAKPTCGLAMTDAENILPAYVDAIDAAGLGDVDAVIRMTGCPNGCARPPTAEVGIYGYGKNDHVVLVGGSREGTRIGHVLYKRISQKRMADALVGLFRAVREHNTGGLPVGEFLHAADPAALRSWIGIEDEAKD
ncbi:MAG TPA: NADPH-dependent assimilatory sulfite reductase hemoprotein subunit [Myxococcota bacterium]|nr:NADPH-dependent assimilatory sulfite reductase hemoprotein subunit [Myxococcota bacterium]